MKVYVLQHVHEIEQEDEDVKMIGVYSSIECANNAMELLKKRPGFSETQEGFSIDEYEIDKTFWVDGFFTTVDVT